MKKKRHTFLIILVVVLTAFIASVLILKTMAESRTADFFIENYILSTGMYSTKEEAKDNVDFVDKEWGPNYCVSIVAYTDFQGQRISTTLVLTVPALDYALNFKGAKDKINSVGEC